MNERDTRIELLFDALPCHSREEIAEQTDLSVAQVDEVLWWIRRPENSAEYGWTVPHAQRGGGDHLFQVVLLDETQSFTPEERHAFMLGALSTLNATATQGTNEGNALRVLARQLSGRARRKCNLTADAFVGAAAMAESAGDTIRDDLENGA